MFIKEQQLFNALKESFMPDLKKSDDPMARYDCYSIIHNIDIELKCRRKHYDDLLIEKKKYDALLLRALNFGTDPVYINSTPSGVWVFRRHLSLVSASSLIRLSDTIMYLSVQKLLTNSSRFIVKQ